MMVARASVSMEVSAIAQLGLHAVALKCGCLKMRLLTSELYPNPSNQCNAACKCQVPSVSAFGRLAAAHSGDQAAC